MHPRRGIVFAAALWAVVSVAGTAPVLGGDPPEQAPAPDVPGSLPPVAASPKVSADETPEATVTLRDGQVITGLLVESDSQKVVLRVGGVNMTIEASAIERYRLVPPVMDQYLEMRQAVGEDPNQIVRLAEWLRSREKYELAVTEVERALTINPNHAEGQELRQLLQKQLELKLKSRTPGAPVGAPGSPASRSPESRRLRDFPLLTEQQINLIKVYEVDLQNPPRLVIKRETIAKLLQQNARNPLVPVTQEGRDAIFRMASRDVLELMFRLQARDLYSEVQVLDQPESMRQFRDQIHRSWIVSSCATTACHGGSEAGRLALYPARPNSDAAVYTNFLILDRFRLSDGTPLIDYDNPERSPLLQLAVARENSIYPHVQVPQGASGRDAYRPVFRTTDEARFRQAAQWIGSMFRPRPDYPVVYPPGAGPVPTASVPNPVPPVATPEPAPPVPQPPPR
ncbi:MAG: hypothetical protein KF745_05155 [Phycisphaeraceae bacterium]|nr:hypothetical protein [Phycisphaeraceae bacterium]